MIAKAINSPHFPQYRPALVFPIFRLTVRCGLSPLMLMVVFGGITFAPWVWFAPSRIANGGADAPVPSYKNSRKDGKMKRRRRDLLFMVLLLTYLTCASWFGLVAASGVPYYSTENRFVCFGLVLGLWPFVYANSLVGEQRPVTDACKARG